MSATPNNGVVSSGTIYNLAGYGNVRVTHTTFLNPTRVQGVSGFHSGSITNGSNSYAWNSIDQLFLLNGDVGDSAVSYSVTFEFMNGLMPGGEGVLGIWGLGRTDLAYTNRISTATVNKNGTFLGDFDLGTSRGASSVTDNAGNFIVKNSLPGDLTPGNPSFNSDLAIIRIDDGVTSITINMVHIGQDGLAFNVGQITPVQVPEPNIGILFIVAIVFGIAKFLYNKR